MNSSFTYPIDPTHRKLSLIQGFGNQLLVHHSGTHVMTTGNFFTKKWQHKQEARDKQENRNQVQPPGLHIPSVSSSYYFGYKDKPHSVVSPFPLVTPLFLALSFKYECCCRPGASP